MSSQIYLDHNSTTPVDPAVADAMLEALRRPFLNPASQHQTGQAARRALESARRGILELLGADVRSFPSDALIFTSGGTEANNLAVLGMARAGRKVLVSAVEHPSIASLGAALSTMGAVFETLPVDVNGRVCLDRLEAGLEEGNVSLVSVMLVNNETGVIQPVPEIAAICRRHSVPMHSDAVQAVGKIPVSFRELDVDLMTVTPHKYYGPRGIGMLIHRAGVSLTPLLHGGFQQGGIRPGTEDVALAVGAHLATSLAVKGQPTHAADLVRLRDAFLESLRIALVGDCVLNGNGARRSPHTLNVAFPGVDRQTLMIAADVAGIAVSTGSACSSGSSEVSAVLLAMGVKRSILESSIRVSFGRGNSLDDVHAAATRIAQIVNDLRG